MADANVHPVPWVLVDSMRGDSKRSEPSLVTRTSHIISPSRSPPVIKAAPAPPSTSARPATSMASALSTTSPVNNSASAMLGVVNAALRTRRSFNASTASSSRSRSRFVDTITGSTTQGTPEASASSASAAASIIFASAIMPVLTASQPRSSRVTRICSATNSGGDLTTPATVRLFCAVRAVIAVMAKPPKAVIVLMSA